MKREYHHWFSHEVGREMEMLVFGHAGAKVLVFPTRDGRFYEFEDIGIVGSVAHKIEAGEIQLYCVDNLAHESFYCFWREPAQRILRHMQYENYLLKEVIPFMDGANKHVCRIAHGCSLGAYLATDLAFRHPHLFCKLSAFSGRYDVTERVADFGDLFDGYFDDNVYYHSPLRFLPNLEDPEILEHLRSMGIILTIGRDDPFYDNNLRFSRVLHSKGIPHQFIEWDGRAHSARYWREMAPGHLVGCPERHGPREAR